MISGTALKLNQLPFFTAFPSFLKKVDSQHSADSACSVNQVLGYSIKNLIILVKWLPWGLKLTHVMENIARYGKNIPILANYSIEY